MGHKNTLLKQPITMTTRYEAVLYGGGAAIRLLFIRPNRQPARKSPLVAYSLS
jgi:hypothetical protein